MRINVTGQAYDTDVPEFQQQKCINWYLETDRNTNVAPAKHGIVLMPTPGITSLFDYGDFAGGRPNAMITIQDRTFAIIDDTFLEISEDGFPNYIDLLNTTSGYVCMERGPSGILMADGTNAYYYDLLTESFTVLTAANDGPWPGNPTSFTYLDGVYYMTFEGTQVFFFSTGPLMADWSVLNFMSANSDPNFLVRAIADHEQLWLFGTAVVEVWASTGDADAPAGRYSGTVLTKGCRAPSTIVAANNTFYWLGTDVAGGFAICSANGFTPVIISNPAINREINKYETTDDAFAFYHRSGQHEFYVITFPTANVTWVYDVFEEAWHQRCSIMELPPTDPDYTSMPQAHRAVAHAFGYQTHFLLDKYSGAVAKYDEDVFTEFDTYILRQRRTGIQIADWGGASTLKYNNSMNIFSNLIADLQYGVGDGTTGQGSDPQIGLSISKDGGHTWSPTIYASIGKQGEYLGRTKWDMLGQGRDVIFDFQITDPIKAVFLGATVDVKSCSS